MVYRWEDLRDNHIQVEWGEDIRRASSRRTPGYHWPKRANWLSNTIVVFATLGAIGIATIMALTLVKSPIRARDEGNASKAEEMETIISAPVPSATPTSSPTYKPSSPPSTLGPTTPPTDRDSQRPSISASTLPTVASSEYPSSPPTVVASALPSVMIYRAPPAPVMCVDEPGFFHNHAGDKVSCDWFQTVGTYNFENNCEKTDIGKACLLSCRDYNDCIMATVPPSYRPSAAPSSTNPTESPTPEPLKDITLAATGDATIKQAHPNGNFGTSSWLHIDTAPMPQDMSPGQTGGAFHVLLRFDLDKHDSTRPVESAVIRLKAANSCSSGGYLQRTHSPHWDEMTTTWSSAPEGDGTEVGRLGNIKSGFWYSVDVTEALALHVGHKTLSLRLYPVSSDECLFVSKDNNSGDGPELHIEYDD